MGSKCHLRNDAAMMVKGCPHERRPDDTVQIGAERLGAGCAANCRFWACPFRMAVSTTKEPRLATSPRPNRHEELRYLLKDHQRLVKSWRRKSTARCISDVNFPAHLF